MRLIDADAIKLEKGFFENIDNVPKFYEWLGEQPTIDAVEVKHGDWVSVKDRLPELGQEVLVYAIGKVDGFGDSVIAMSKRHIFRLFSSSEGVEVWTSPWPYFSSNYEITHWMPLPDAPKGERR